MESFQKAQVPGEGYVATAKVKRNESIKLAMKAFNRKCIMFSPPIRQFIWENSIYTLDGREVDISYKYNLTGCAMLIISKTATNIIWYI